MPELGMEESFNSRKTFFDALANEATRRANNAGTLDHIVNAGAAVTNNFLSFMTTLAATNASTDANIVNKFGADEMFNNNVGRQTNARGQNSDQNVNSAVQGHTQASVNALTNRLIKAETIQDTIQVMAELLAFKADDGSDSAAYVELLRNLTGNQLPPASAAVAADNVTKDK